MKKSQRTMIRKPFALVATSCLAVSVQAATLDGEASIGLINYNLDHTSRQFSMYNGVYDDSVKLLGEFVLSYHPEGQYLFFSGSDLGLSSRKLGAEWGQYGDFGLKFQHKELKTLLADGAKTPFNGVGTNALTLPGGFVKADEPAGMTTLASDLKNIDLSVERSGDRIEYFFTPDDSWRFSFAVEREETEGVRSLGGTLGASGRWAVSTILPAPIDQVTEHVEVAAAFASSLSQWEARYHWSRFNNRLESFTWDAPYVEGGGDAFPSQSLTSMDPDNDYHNIGLSGALNMAPKTRLVVVANLSRLEQDEELLAYTVNPASTISDPLPRDTAKARIDNKRLYLKLSNKSIRRLSLNLSYRYDKSDNKTQDALFQRVINDTGDQVAVDDPEATSLHAFDRERNRFRLDGRYYLGNGNTLQLGYQQESNETHRAVEETRENSIDAKFSSRFSTKASASIGWQRDKRRAEHEYDYLIEYEDHHADEYISTVNADERFDNHPLLRQFDIANRDRDLVSVNVNLFPTTEVVVGVYYRETREDYPESQLGLGSNDQQSATLDVSYSPDEVFTVYGYYTDEQMAFELLGRSFDAIGPPGTKVSKAEDVDNNWMVDNRDDIDTIGLGSRFELLRGDVRIDVKAYYSREKNSLDFTTGANLTAEALPEDRAIRKGVDVEANYALRSNMEIGLGLAHESYDISRWDREGLAPGSDAAEGVIALLEPESDYSASIIYTAMRYKW